jgi:hypothetical protein
MLKLNAFDIIKSNVSIYDVISRYGFELNRAGFIVCPFHNEKTGSMKIYGKTNRFKCFGCGVWGDVIDFVARMERTNVIGAAEIIGIAFGLDIFVDNPTCPEVLRKAEEERVRRERVKAKRKAQDEFIEEVRREVRDRIRRNNDRYWTVRRNEDALGLDLSFSLYVSLHKEKEWLEYLYDILSGFKNPDSRYVDLITEDRLELAKLLYFKKLGTSGSPFKNL